MTCYSAWTYISPTLSQSMSIRACPSVTYESCNSTAREWLVECPIHQGRPLFGWLRCDSGYSLRLHRAPYRVQLRQSTWLVHRGRKFDPRYRCGLEPSHSEGRLLQRTMCDMCVIQGLCSVSPMDDPRFVPPTSVSLTSLPIFTAGGLGPAYLTLVYTYKPKTVLTWTSPCLVRVCKATTQFAVARFEVYTFLSAGVG